MNTGKCQQDHQRRDKTYDYSISLQYKHMIICTDHAHVIIQHDHAHVIIQHDHQTQEFSMIINQSLR